ncbi:MAG TPA: type II toxin-antitoxin system VapC family toxin [Gemmatimonadota bacterium]|nr:type II toxin-antitoxin system VapC family toxin [Gemmatimonadota bacterium]
MILTDVNVLVYAHREEMPDHDRYRGWLERTLESAAAYGMAELVLSCFLRIVTHPAIFPMPTPLDRALGFCAAVRNRRNCVRIAPGDRHWGIYTGLCRTAGTKGNLIPDAYLAALAIESGSEWATTDRDYARFPDLRWFHPLERTG